MKMKIRNFRIATVAAILVTICLATGATNAQRPDKLGGGRLVGTWDAAVRITDCTSGNVIATFSSIASFNQGGTTIGSTAGIPQSLRTPEHGIWGHMTGHLYQFKFKTFTFNATGQAVGYSVVAHTINLNNAADAYYSYGTATFYTLDGTQIGSACSDAVGTRMQF